MSSSPHVPRRVTLDLTKPSAPIYHVPLGPMCFGAAQAPFHSPVGDVGTCLGITDPRRFLAIVNTNRAGVEVNGQRLRGPDQPAARAGGRSLLSGHLRLLCGILDGSLRLWRDIFNPATSTENNTIQSVPSLLEPDPATFSIAARCRTKGLGRFAICTGRVELSSGFSISSPLLHSASLTFP